MDVDESPPTAPPAVDREKTAPFLLRTFVKIGSFHRLTLFDDNTPPTTDEHQLFTWKDATLREVLTTLRAAAPQTPEYRHPLARFAFRAAAPDPALRGRLAARDLGLVYSRDILGEPGARDAPAPRLVLDADPAVPAAAGEPAGAPQTLAALRVAPGDFLLVAVLLPKSVALPPELGIKGAAPAPAPAAGWKTAGAAGKADGGWGRAGAGAGAGPGAGAGAGAGRGGGHWRGGPDALGRGGRAGGGGGAGRGADRDRDRELDRERDRDRDRDRVPPPRRSVSPPPRRGEGWGARGGRGGGRGGGRDRERDRRTPSRSRSPPRRRGRYD